MLPHASVQRPLLPGARPRTASCSRRRWSWTREGRVGEAHYHRGVIRSAARLSYAQAQAILEGSEKPRRRGWNAPAAARWPCSGSSSRGACPWGPWTWTCPRRTCASASRERWRRSCPRCAWTATASWRRPCSRPTRRWRGNWRSREAPALYRVHEDPTPDKLEAPAAAAQRPRAGGRKPGRPDGPLRPPEAPGGHGGPQGRQARGVSRARAPWPRRVTAPSCRSTTASGSRPTPTSPRPSGATPTSWSTGASRRLLEGRRRSRREPGRGGRRTAPEPSAQSDLRRAGGAGLVPDGLPRGAPGRDLRRHGPGIHQVRRPGGASRTTSSTACAPSTPWPTTTSP